MTGETLEKPANKTCESCGAEFSCGAAQEKCWCFEIDLKPETLAELRERFTACLCRDCLQSHELTAISTNEFKV